MAESRAETLVRLHLEQRTAALFVEFLKSPLRNGCRFVTLLCFDYGPGGPFENVAFNTSLVREDLITTAEELLASWEDEQPRLVSREYFEAFRLPDSERIRACADFFHERLPGSIGFALLFGVGSVVSYVSRADRDGVAGILRELLPLWRSEEH